MYSKTTFKLSLRVNFRNNEMRTSHFFHICTVDPVIIKVFYYQLTHKRTVFKGVLKFTLKLQ